MTIPTLEDSDGRDEKSKKKRLCFTFMYLFLETINNYYLSGGVIDSKQIGQSGVVRSGHDGLEQECFHLSPY